MFRDVSFWLPLLALFTGARLEELGQARARDLREEDGYVFLDLNTLEEDQSLKSATSKRPVPLHPELLACGFGEYVASLKKARDARLFPDLHADSRGTYTASWSKWWGRYARQIGINDRRKVFHSFRHNFKDACRRAGIEEAIHDALTGHSHKSVGRSYGLGYPVVTLAQAINKIDYPALDLNHIKVKKRKSA